MAFNIFDFNSIPGTSVQKIGTGASMPSYQPQVQYQPTQSQQSTQQPVQSNTMRFFKDEEEANQKMLQAGLSQEKANELHKKRRNDLLGKISQKDGEALIKMRDAGLRADEAAKLVKKKRDETPDTRPLWKKAGEGTLNFLAGNLDTVLKYGGNILDVGTFGQTGIGEEVKGMTEQNKQLFGDSTAFKVGTYAPDVALGVSPIGGGYLAGAKGLANLAGRSAIVGAGFGASTPLLEKGSDATLKDVAIGAGIGATAGAVLPVVGAGLVKGARAIKPYITKTLPQNLQVSGQFNRADLTNVSDRLSKLTGKDIEVDDASRWLLDREIKGDLATQRKQVQGVVQKSMDDADNLLASKTGDIGSTKEAQSLRGALKEKLDNYGSYTKEGNFKPSAGNESQASKMMALIDNPSMTLKEMNDGRRILADGLFSKQGTMKELASKEGWQNVWKDTSAFIEKKAPGFRILNKNTEVGIAIDKAMIKKETAEQTKAMLSYLGLGGGTGGAIGYGTSGGDIGSTIKGIGIGFGVGQLSRILNTPAVKSNLAYYLNKLSASSRKSIQDLQKGIEIKPENIGKIVEEMKLLGPGKKTSTITQSREYVTPSGEKSTIGNKTVKTTNTPNVITQGGNISKTTTALYGKVGERPGTVAKLEDKQGLIKQQQNILNKDKKLQSDAQEINKLFDNVRGRGTPDVVDRLVLKMEGLLGEEKISIPDAEKILKLSKTKLADDVMDRVYRKIDEKGYTINNDGFIEKAKPTIIPKLIQSIPEAKPLITPFKPTQAPTIPKTIETPPTAKKTGIIEPKAIPEGYFKNAFGEIVKNPNSKKAGSLNIGQIGKDLGLIKKDPLIEEARKYKSIEEFVKALTETPKKLNITDIKPNQTRDYTYTISGAGESRSKGPVLGFYNKKGKFELVDGNHRYYEAIDRGDNEIIVKYPRWFLDDKKFKSQITDIYNKAHNK